MKKTFIFMFCIILLIKLTSAVNQGTLEISIVGDKCMLNFAKGWNFFSFCKNLEDNNPSVVFSSVENKYRYVMRWNPLKQEFDIYSPKSLNNPIPDLNDDESYFIYFYNPDSLEVHGSSVISESKSLESGWNAPAYQMDFSTPISLLTEPIEEDYRYVMKWNSLEQEFDIYSPKSMNNPFDSISQSEGLFIYPSTEVSLSI
jgi:hypothetical protein